MVTAGEGGAKVRRGHVSIAGLRARGWTAELVRRLLGEPDLLRVNPYSASAPRTRLYRVERVEAAEQSAEFRAVAAAAVRRSIAARAAVGRRRRELSARVAVARREAGDGASDRPSGAVAEPEIRMRRPGRAPDDQEVVHPPPQGPP
ncbi:MULTISPECIES: hypothetical protein [unclassified Streptomyces]|uniref:hypothetical protein n=1 Tax=unclassified Streptomyces TaxID=2593676 RepID=UPI00378FA409